MKKTGEFLPIIRYWEIDVPKELCPIFDEICETTILIYLMRAVINFQNNLGPNCDFPYKGKTLRITIKTDQESIKKLADLNRTYSFSFSQVS